MVTHSLDDEVLQAAVDSVAIYGNLSAAARETNIPRATLQHRVRLAERRGITAEYRQFEIDDLPSEGLPTEELIEQRKRKFERKRRAETARKLVPIRIKIDGPIGICHFGDPHVDDDGTDLELLEKHLNAVRNTNGLFAANLGDLQNNWIGRLARLYAEQSTSAKEAWQLTEWLVESVDWLYIIGGNHDLWSGEGDPLKWISAHAGTIYEPWGVRAELKFPNGKSVIINARHDFAGHSMWNPVHGPGKAVQMGWRDHILTCGHKHVSFGAGPYKCPATGLLSYAIRCAGYKTFDRYAKEKGLPDQNAFASAVTIIKPEYDDDDPRLISVHYDVEEGAEYLTWLRNR